MSNKKYYVCIKENLSLGSHKGCLYYESGRLDAPNTLVLTPLNPSTEENNFKELYYRTSRFKLLGHLKEEELEVAKLLYVEQ